MIKAATLQADLIIENAKIAERTQNATKLRKSLEPVWEFNTEPDLSDFEQQVQARLLRHIGFCLVLYGRNSGDSPMLNRGIGHLITSIKNAKGESKEKAKAVLGYAYVLEGNIPKALKWINDARLELNSKLYLYNLANKMSILGWLEKPEEALEIFQRIRHPIKESGDSYLGAFFYNKVSSVYWYKGDYEKSAFYLEKTIELTKKTKNIKQLATALNNAAGVYTELGQFEKSHHLAKKSFVLFKSIGNKAGLAHILDTEANTYFKEKKYQKSLETVDLALEEYENLDFSGKAESLFLKIKIYLKLNKIDKAIKLNRELRDFVFTHIGESAYEKFHKQLVDVIGKYQVSTNEAIPVNISPVFKKTHIAFRTLINGVEHIVVAVKCNNVDTKNEYIAKCGERFYFGKIKYNSENNTCHIGTKNLSGCKIFGRVEKCVPSMEWNDNCSPSMS